MYHPNFCISRIDNHSSHGWMVRIAREGIKHQKFFSDAAYEGKRLAQQAAKDFRDETLKKLTAAGKTPRAKKLVYRQKRNRSGVIGITRVMRKKRDGTQAPYWCVTWRPTPGVQRGTTISILRYGEKRAFEMAVNLRNKKLMERYGSGVFRKLKALRDATQPDTPDFPQPQQPPTEQSLPR